MKPKHPGRKTSAPARSYEETGESAQRLTYNFLGFWKVCNNKRCRRAHACAGDLRACSKRHWTQVPQDVKSWIYAGITARCEGASPAEAVRIADEKMARFAASKPLAGAIGRHTFT